MRDSFDILDACFIAMVAIGCSLAGFGVGKNWERETAIEAGVAHWSCDPQTGEKTFVWEAPKQ